MGRRGLIVLVYRVFPFHASAADGEPGHPMYEHRPQRGGRIDHPDYFVWYLAAQPEAAAGEVFGNLAVWERSMFEFPSIPGSRRALGIYHLPDDIRLLDLDDPLVLAERSLRPTQIVMRNLSVSQTWGHSIWDERYPHDRKGHWWQAVAWWSSHRPTWTIIGSWLRPAIVDVQDLDLDHPTIRDASAALNRPLR